MAADVVRIVCSHCHAVNGIPQQSLSGAGQGVAKCGECQQPLFEGKAIDLAPEQIRSQLQADVPVLIEFWASWCGSCNTYAPIFNQAAQQFEPFVRLAKVNAEKGPDLLQEYAIETIPTLVLFFRGKEISRTKSGLPIGQLEQWMVAQLQPHLAATTH